LIGCEQRQTTEQWTSACLHSLGIAVVDTCKAGGLAVDEEIGNNWRVGGPGDGEQLGDRRWIRRQHGACQAVEDPEGNPLDSNGMPNGDEEAKRSGGRSNTK
jgi:hypothetical protein